MEDLSGEAAEDSNGARWLQPLTPPPARLAATRADPRARAAQPSPPCRRARTRRRLQPRRVRLPSRTFTLVWRTAGEPSGLADKEDDSWDGMFGDDEDEGEEEEVDDSEARRRAVWASVVCRRRCHPCGRSLDSVRACPSHGWVSASQPGSEDLPERQAHRSTRRCARPSACSCACLCCPMPWCSTLFAACLRPPSRRCLEHRDSLGGCGAAQCAASDGPHVFACCVRVSMAMFAVM
jgi:hypothetical protein